MCNLKSVRVRFLFSIVSNALRAIIGFATGLLIARALNPAGYGDLMFLLGSFVAIRTLLDMGSSSAFFTFLSQRARGIKFYWIYISWLAVQFLVTLIFLWFIIPSGLFQKVWLGHNREIVLLAFAASFMQQQVWQTVGQIGEAMRKTVKVQLLNLGVALFYFIIIVILASNEQLSIQKILYVLVCQYMVATLYSYYLLRESLSDSVVDASVAGVFRDYWKYCKPLLVLSFVSFTYDFTDKWMLQKFGGATQQGYFQVASQFAAVSLLATTSILNVFWKEIASAWESQDRTRVAMLYRKVSRGLVMMGAMISGLLLPWSEQIVRIFLGAEYLNAWPVLAVMLLYPIHQSMGQIGGTMFLASGQTRKYMFVSIGVMLLSIPFTYFVLSSSTHDGLSGLEFGALGMACKMVILGIISVNVQAWIIAGFCGWKFDWLFQVVGVPLMIGLGFAAKIFVGLFWTMGNASMSKLLLLVITSSLIYVCFAMAALWRLPWLVGTDQIAVNKCISSGFQRWPFVTKLMR